MNRFFEINSVLSLLTQLDQHVYHELHEKLLHQPTRREKQLEKMVQNPIGTHKCSIHDIHTIILIERGNSISSRKSPTKNY